jgi:hypothetical protein
MRMARLIIRRLLATFLACAATLTVAMMTLPDDLVDRTIENNRVIEQEFRQASAAIETFHRSAGRQPTEQEVAHLPGWPTERKYALFVFFGNAGMCDDRPGFPAAAKGSYVIGAWRGHWMDCYEPRSGRTNLKFTRDDYALFGSTTNDRFAGIAFVGLLIAFAGLLWTGGRVCPLRRSARKD